MPRAATTADAFNAIAEPRRRAIINALARDLASPRGGRSPGHAVGELVKSLRLTQPAVSKHLGVLRKVGLVSVTKQGQRRLYRLEPKELKPVYDWAASFERFWSRHIDRIKERAERSAAESRAKTSKPPHQRGNP